MDRRQFAKRTALTIAAAGLGGPAFTAPACGPSKEKAVRVAGFVIDLSREAVPLLNLLGALDLAELVNTKFIPAMEKMKEALSRTDIPTSASTLETVRNALKGIETALLQLPDSARRTTIIGILASVRMLLLTVEAFVDSEMPTSTTVSETMRSTTRQSNAALILKAFEVVRQ